MAKNKVWVSPESLKPDTVTTINGVTVSNYILSEHNPNNVSLPPKRTNAFKGVVIHNTDRVKDSTGNYISNQCRQYTAATLNDNVATRTHYYVCDDGAWKNLHDDDVNWSCGDGAYGEGNNGCISLEIIMSSKNKTEDLKSRDNGARIAGYILAKTGMTVDDMYTHNYFLNVKNGVKGDYNTLCTTPTPTRNCPFYIVWDWEGFRKQVDKYVKALGGRSVYEPTPSPAPQPSNTKKVKDIYQACSKAAIRAACSKNAQMYGRVVYGNYYPVDLLIKNDSGIWLKHADQNAYSMYKDELYLFKKCDHGYEIKKTTTMVNIRANPSSKSDKVDTVAAGTDIYVMADFPTIYASDGYYWRTIIYRNKICYIADEYLK